MNRDKVNFDVLEDLVDVLDISEAEKKETAEALRGKISQTAVALLILGKEADVRESLYEQAKGVNTADEVWEFLKRNFDEEEVGVAFAKASEKVLEQYLAGLFENLQEDRQNQVIEKMSVVLGNYLQNINA